MTDIKIIKSAIKYPNGKIFTGKRHNNCFEEAWKKNEPLPKKGSREQGFMTSENKFVSREEAAKIALRNGQVEKLKFSETRLFSEDLY